MRRPPTHRKKASVGGVSPGVNEAAAVIFAKTLQQLRAATTAHRARQVAARGLRRLRRVRGLNGSPLLHMLRESRDARIDMLIDSAAPRHGARGDFSQLTAGGLTRRECEVLGWIAHGKRDAEIAAILGIARKTVGKHIEHLLSKLHVETRTAAVNAAYERVRRLAGPKPFR